MTKALLMQLQRRMGPPQLPFNQTLQPCLPVRDIGTRCGCIGEDKGMGQGGEAFQQAF